MITRDRFKRAKSFLGQVPKTGVDPYMRWRDELPADLKVRYLPAGKLSVSGDGFISTSRGGGGIVAPGIPVFPSGAPNAFEDDRQALLRGIRDDLDVIAATDAIDRGLIGRVVTVGTTAVLVAKATELKGYLITNPSTTSGLTSTGTLLASALRAANSSGNTQAAPLGVANYDNIRLFLDISASGGGLVTVNSLTQDPLSLNWATGQATVFSQTAVGTYYANLGNLGVDETFALSWTVGAGGSSTFSVGYVLKDGLAGTSSGLSNTVYLGGSSGVSTVSGYTLLEGKEFKSYFRNNTELWAISNGSVGLRVFELL